MGNTWFRFKQFRIDQHLAAMKVTTDGCLFGAWVSMMLKTSHQRKLLDIGTGTGLLSLMIGQQHDLQIDAVELDPQAVLQARENIMASPWPDKIHVIEGDARAIQYKQKYDVIISNPPFYERQLASPDPARRLAHHSDEMALNDLLAIVDRTLSEDGSCWLLLPFSRKDDVLKVIAEHHLFAEELVIVRPSPLHPPFRIMMKATRVVEILKTTENSIREADHSYSSWFSNLLEPYYLER